MLLLSKAHSQGSPHNPSQLHTFPSLSLSLPFSGSQPFVVTGISDLGIGCNWGEWPEWTTPGGLLGSVGGGHTPLCPAAVRPRLQRVQGSSSAPAVERQWKCSLAAQPLSAVGVRTSLPLHSPVSHTDLELGAVQQLLPDPLHHQVHQLPLETPPRGRGRKPSHRQKSPPQGSPLTPTNQPLESALQTWRPVLGHTSLQGSPPTAQAAWP